MVKSRKDFMNNMNKFTLMEPEKSCIIDIESNVLSLDVILQLENKINILPKDYSIALNMEKVNAITNDFFNFINKMSKTRTLSISNLTSDVFVLFNLTNTDKIVKIFLNSFDFTNNKRVLINRHLQLVD